MLVTPRTERVELLYVRNAIDWIGLAISVVALALLLACTLSRPAADRLAAMLARPFGPLVKLFESFPRTLTLMLLVGFIGAGWATRTTLTAPDKDYEAAQEAYRAREFEEAIRRLEDWTATDRDTFKQATSLFQLGVSYSELGDFGASALAHERLRFEFPNVNYGAGTLYHLANSYAKLGVPDRAREYAKILEAEHPENNSLERLRREHPGVFD
jgi:outer membrane protein assembly factor BamD (BamD/ComL family)